MALTKKEEDIFKNIVVASENDPNHPEFPFQNPRFPATPTYQIEVPNFTNVWLKDESFNPTGTHKDRMAWEIVISYKYFLLSKKEGKINQLPYLSIVSSGSAALAIQTLLRQLGLPGLRVLMSVESDIKLVERLRAIGCQVYLEDLNKTVLSWKDILMFTDNETGFDITSNEAYDPGRRFYDWLSYEILNSNADYIFVPFGTGVLYENIMNIVKKELVDKAHDPRFMGNREKLGGVSIIGATTCDKQSKATKLYAPFLPFAHYSEQWIRFYKYANLTGEMSRVHHLHEQYLDEAINLAQKLDIQSEPSGIAGLALLLQMKNDIPKDKKILIVNTGKTKWE